VNYIARGATISKCGLYRYSLWREWRGTHDPMNWRWQGITDGTGKRVGMPKSCLFVMLNPSTADGEQDDPTIRRCVGFAKSWNFERLEVVNLFAYRATNPRDVLDSQMAGIDVIGPDNIDAVQSANEDAGMVVCAWGGNVSTLDPARHHIETVRGWLLQKKHFALGLTKDGHPRHPLYLPSSALPVELQP